MANDRMFIVHEPTGVAFTLAKHFGIEWDAIEPLQDFIDATTEHIGAPSGEYAIHMESEAGFSYRSLSVDSESGYTEVDIEPLPVEDCIRNAAADMLAALEDIASDPRTSRKTITELKARARRAVQKAKGGSDDNGRTDQAD